MGLGLWVCGCGGSSETDAAGEASVAGETSSGDATGTMTGSDPGVPRPGCGENLLEDPGFEDGSSGVAWDHTSALFGTPICDASCTEDVGANPFSGRWWVWFGGVAQPDIASVQQSVLIPEGNVVLRFRFSVNAASGSGNDVFSVALDGKTLLEISDANAASYGGWRVVEQEIPSYADGGEHRLSFEAVLSGRGLTNFFLDDVELLLCGQEEPGTSGSSSSQSGTTEALATSGADSSSR